MVALLFLLCTFGTPILLGAGLFLWGAQDAAQSGVKHAEWRTFLLGLLLVVSMLLVLAQQLHWIV